MNEKRDLYIDLLSDVIVKKRMGDDVTEEVLQHYRDKAQKFHRNDEILKELEND